MDSRVWQGHLVGSPHVKLPHSYSVDSCLKVMERSGKNCLLNVTFKDISVISVAADIYAGELKKKLVLWSGFHAIDIS